MADAQSTVSRRSFIVGCGAAAATAAVAAPVVPTFAGSPTSPRLPPRSALIEGWRAIYAAEVETLAESLRPRFEAGELHAYRENEDIAAIARGEAYDSPLTEIEEHAAAHFGLGTPRHEWRDGDRVTAVMILAVARHAEAVQDGTEGYAGDFAAESVAWDVLALARERGWYTPTEDESDLPSIEVES